MAIELRRIIDCDSADYDYMSQLMTKSFPKEEYRDPDEMCIYTSTESRFHNNVIIDTSDDEPKRIGLLTYWDFDYFIYIEHFAIDTAMRNCGYGSKALTFLSEFDERPVVLEVELPDTGTAARRIAFYQRQGFSLSCYEYTQPPYREGDGLLPMRIMIKARPESSLDIDSVVSMIYRNVYGVITS